MKHCRLGEPVQPQFIAVRRTLTKTSFDVAARVAAPPASLERRDVRLAKDVCLCLASTKDPKGGFEFIKQPGRFGNITSGE